MRAIFFACGFKSCCLSYDLLIGLLRSCWTRFAGRRLRNFVPAGVGQKEFRLVRIHVFYAAFAIATCAVLMNCGGGNSAPAPATNPSTAAATAMASAPATATAPATGTMASSTTAPDDAVATASAPAATTMLATAAVATAPTEAEIQAAATAVMSVSKAKTTLELIKTTRSFEESFLVTHGAMGDTLKQLETAANDVIKEEGKSEERRKIFTIALNQVVDRADTIAKRPNETNANKVKAGEIRGKFDSLRKC